jgi:hypothetical protein
MRTPSRAGFPAFIVGSVTLADLFLMRALLHADELRVYFAGRALDWQCAFRAATGLPCPTCGMTRAVVMSLHGELARAWKLAPAAPVAVAGAFLFALAMLALAAQQSGWIAGTAANWHRRLRTSALAYAATLVAVWLGGWAFGLRAALAMR